ncbi:unnamed protein product [Acanthoscelides obtectus]|uniref:Uncharacterized protein n=1 Tax=Acanthoscelides obtectus TaxID=200917 RepID=A0A9P0LD28_ACAOB|nr:unnamed protein product [Acanthoscelides obtectus]CAK1661230.1 hypothetical protein AOBTE_LOCUS22527 [Acanthoscelides obtectus]
MSQIYICFKLFVLLIYRFTSLKFSTIKSATIGVY